MGTISGGTAINLVPDEAAIGVDFRTLPSQDEETILLQLWSLLGPDVEIRRVDGARSVETNADNEWVREVFDVMKRLTGKAADSCRRDIFHRLFCFDSGIWHSSDGHSRSR